jgi:hypothetical protein
VPQRPITLRHLGAASVMVKGTVTGLVYLFGDGTTQLTVDQRDATALLATGRFVVAS